MSINPLNTPQTTPPAHHHGGHGHGRAVMDAAAKTLGVSDDELKQDLAGGQSLDDIATAKGITHDQLVAGLGDALKQSGAQAGDVSALAERLATRRWDERRAAADDASSATSRPPLGQMVDVEA